jgi:hypothetical protein
MTPRDLASVLKVGKSTLDNLLIKHNNAQDWLSSKDKPHFGCPRKTSIRMDRIIKREVDKKGP